MPEQPADSVIDEIVEIDTEYKNLLEKHISQPCLGDPQVLRVYIDLAERLLANVARLGRDAITDAQRQVAEQFVNRWWLDMPPHVRIYCIMMEARIREMKQMGNWENLHPRQQQGVLDAEADIPKLKKRYSLGEI